MFFSHCFWRHVPRWTVVVVLLMGSSASQIQAQPVQPSVDNTGTIVTRDDDRFDITGGSLFVNGENLFHSFEQFGLNQGQVANFLANPNIRNILSRVIGGDASVIDGLLQVTGGTPNLYLMNPAGIIFGSGARLDLPASFTATTATGIDFNQEVFSAFQENDYRVLVGDPTSLIFAIVEPGSIVNAGVLSVPDFANLNLIGGQVLNLGTLTGGGVTITALPGRSTLRITPEGRILSLDLSLPEGIALENLTPAKLPQLLLGTGLEQATDLAVQEDGSVWLVAPNSESSAAIVGSEVNILAEKAIAGDALIEGDRLDLRAETLGTRDQPLFTQVNALSTDTALSNGDQFLVNLQDLTSLNLKAGTEGFLSLTVQGALLDLDPDLDIQAKTLKLDTLGGIGTIDSPLQTAVETIAAQASQTGGIFIQNQNNLSVTTVDQLAGVRSQSGTIALQVREGNLTLNPNEDASENSAQPILQTVNSGDIILEAGQINLHSPVQSAGAQTYQGNLVLGTDVQLKSSQQGAIVFQGTIDSDQSSTPRNLSVQTGGLTQFNGAIGSISPLATLETDVQGGETEQTIFNTNLVQTIAHQRFQDPVQLAQPIQFNGQDIEFGHTLEGQSEGQEINLGVNADRFLAQGIGAQNPLASIRINTKGTLQIQGNAHSIDNLELTSQEGFIQTENLHIQGGSITLETQGLTATVGGVGIANPSNLQPGDIQVGAIQSQSGSVNISAKRLFQTTTSTPIEGDRLDLRAETLGTREQPLFTQVNALSTDTALSNGDQFLVNLQDLSSLNLKAGTEGFLSLTVQGAILDPDPDLDIQAKILKLDTLGGIGTIDSSLQTAIETIAAQASQTGGVFIQNQNNLSVTTVDQLVGIRSQAGTIALQVREGNLTLNPSNNPTENSAQPILQTVNSGDIILEADQINLHSSVQSAGAQTYQGNLVLGTDVQLKSSQQRAIVFQGTIDSDQSATPRNLSVETGGLTQFNGAIGSISPLATLETDAQGGETEQTIFNTNLVQTIAHQRFQDPVQLAQPIQFNGQDIEFGNTLEGGQAVELGITTDRFLAQGIGAQNPLASIRINTKGTLQIQGNAHSINNLTLTSQEGFIEAGNLHTQGGAVTLETLGINTTITNHAGIQPGDIQVGAIQTRGGAVNVSAKRFFRAMNTLNGASISTIGPNTGDITIVHGGGLLNQPFIVGDPNRSNNGVVGALRTNIATVPGVQAFLGSVKGGNVQILAGRDNPPVNIQFISPSVGNSLTGSISNLATPLGTIEDLNTLEFQNAFGQDPIRQATPQAVQELLKAVNHRNLENQDAEKFAAVYLYYNRSTNAANEREDTIFSRGRILRPDDPPLAEDGLSLLVVTEQEIKQIQLPDVVNRIRVSQSIQLLRDRLMDQYNIRGYKPFAAQLYDWIALPIKEALVDTPVDNLIFVLGRGLRSLPVAALYNRRTDQFLIEEYGFALVPSISYLDSEAVSLRQTQALAMGASSFANNDNAPLPAVPFELDLIRQTRPTQVLQNEQFTFENLQTILSQRQQAFSDQPLIMHLATHADFGEVIVLEPEDLQFRSSLNFRAASNRQIKDISYLQFFDRKLRLEELQDLELNKAGAVELFVISACNTATGNDNAELGFAGLSLQMGAQSAVASLWQVSDVGTMVLMGEFYHQLNQNISRVQALRQAQLAMLRGQTGQVEQNALNLSNRSIPLQANLLDQILVNTPNPNRLNLSHPFYWSAFTLIGSPW